MKPTKQQLLRQIDALRCRVEELFEDEPAVEPVEYKITEAEQEVLKLWAGGFKAQHIAYTRGSSVGTVQAQLRSLNRTFGTTNRGDLIQKAKEAGLL